MYTAGSMILRAGASALPIIIGLAYFAMSMFGFSWRFATLPESVIMLWALLLGDELQNIFHALIPINFIIAWLFCYAWVFFSNDCIMTSFLAITEDGYIKQ